MGNAPSASSKKKQHAAIWTIPLNRTGIPALKGLKGPVPKRQLYRKPSLRTWDNDDNNDDMPTWDDVRRYIVHGPQHPRQHPRHPQQRRRGSGSKRR